MATMKEMDKHALKNKEKNMMIRERFVLNESTVDKLRGMKSEFGFGEFGKTVYYRTYSRKKDDKQENWHDNIIRIVEGVFSARKDFYCKNYLKWEENKYQEYAEEFAISMFQMQFLPAGRGIFGMGTDKIYQKGAASLNNCGFVTTENLAEGLEWVLTC